MLWISIAVCVVAMIGILALLRKPQAPGLGVSSQDPPREDADKPARAGAKLPRSKKASLPPIALPTISAEGQVESSITDVVDLDVDLGQTEGGSGVPVVPSLVDPEAEPDEPTRTHPLILVSACGQSDRGKKRQRNEDTLGIVENKGLYIVADGMGGHRGGAEASKLAVETVTGLINDAARPTNVLDERLPVHANRLADAIRVANEAVHKASHETRDLAKMGTTMVACHFALRKQRVYIGHVGDSRVYRLRNNVLEQITKDHTLAELGVRGPLASRLSRAVGVAPNVTVDMLVGKPQAGDVYLLCSDGLTKMVDEPMIEKLLRQCADPQKAVEALIAKANDLGGRDNVTVIVVKVQDSTQNAAA
jgi:protein phosphatase